MQIKLISEDELYHFNPYHDTLGKFASKVGSNITSIGNKTTQRILKKVGSFSIKDKIKSIDKKTIATASILALCGAEIVLLGTPGVLTKSTRIYGTAVGSRIM